MYILHTYICVSICGPGVNWHVLGTIHWALYDEVMLQTDRANRCSTENGKSSPSTTGDCRDTSSTICNRALATDHARCVAEMKP